MIFDARRLPISESQHVAAFDADTGEPLTPLFFHDDATGLTGRYLQKDGWFVIDPHTMRVCQVWEFRRVRFELRIEVPAGATVQRRPPRPPDPPIVIRVKAGSCVH